MCVSDEPSDPYLCAGYDRKSLSLSHDASVPVTFRVEVDISGTGTWQVFQTVKVPQSKTERMDFPAEFQAYWVRLVADRDCAATADFAYE